MATEKPKKLIELSGMLMVALGKTTRLQQCNVYLSAYSKKDAAAILAAAGYRAPSAHEFKNYWRDSWGTSVPFLSRQRGIWVQEPNKQTFHRKYDGLQSIARPSIDRNLAKVSMVLSAPQFVWGEWVLHVLVTDTNGGEAVVGLTFDKRSSAEAIRGGEHVPI